MKNSQRAICTRTSLFMKPYYENILKTNINLISESSFRQVGFLLEGFAESSAGKLDKMEGHF